MLGAPFQQIPEIPVQIFEDGDRSIRLDFRFPYEADSYGEHPTVVSPEIIGAQEEENPSAGLVADDTLLLRCRRPGEQQADAVRTWRRYQHPALVLLRLVYVLDDSELQFFRIEPNGFVVIPNHESDV